jgi:formylglycine-generating enzyme required for sulfatase activity
MNKSTLQYLSIFLVILCLSACESSPGIPSQTSHQAEGSMMVRIPGKNFEMGKYEVTQKEWRDIMGNNPSQFTACGEDCPVDYVSWDDIQIFLQKLNAKTGTQYRLATSDEWEYACYGGNKTEFCGGNDVDAVAWYTDNSNYTPHPVGKKQANGYGLYDMSGNVSEWTSDCENRNCTDRVLRGGAWLDVAVYARAANRSYFAPAKRYYFFGFRLARTLP